MDELHNILEIQWNLKEWGSIKSDTNEQVRACFNLRPLAILSQLLGLFPVQNLCTDKASELRHSVLSLLSIYGYLLYSVIAYLHSTHFIYQYEFLRILSTWADIRFAAGIVIFSLSWDTYIVLLKKCDEFDYRFILLPVKIYRRRSKHRRYVYILIAVSVIIVLVARGIHIFLYHFSDDSVNIIYPLTEALIHVPRLFQITLYVFTCDEITFRFSQLHRSWASYFKYLSDTKANAVDVYLDKYRLLNLHLLNCIRLMDNFFGLRLALLLLNCFSDALFDIFCFYYFYLDISFSLYLSKTVYVILSAWIILWTSSELISESQKIKKYIFSVLTLSMPLALRIEIDHLSQELLFHKEEITAWGLFSLSRKLIGSFSLHLTAYFIALSQMSSIVNDLERQYNNSKMHLVSTNGNITLLNNLLNGSLEVN